MLALSLLQLVPKPAGRIVRGEVWLEGEDLLQKDEKAMRSIRGKKISMILQDPQTSLNPVFSIGNQVIEAIGLRGRREGRGADGAGRRRAPTSPGGRPGAAGARLPPPNERRHEATHRWRHRDRMRAKGAHRRRANDVARRDHTSPIPPALEGHPKRDRHLHHLHHPRLRHRGEALRPSDGHVRGSHRGERPRPIPSSTTPRTLIRRHCSAVSLRWMPAKSGFSQSKASPPTSGICRKAATSLPDAHMPMPAATHSIRPRSRWKTATPHNAGN